MQITLKDDRLIIKFQQSPVLLAQVRSLPSRRFDGIINGWVAPYNSETWDAMAAYGWDIRAIPRPSFTGYRIEGTRNRGFPRLKIVTPYSPINKEICSRLPRNRMWSEPKQAWYCAAVKENLLYLKRKLPLAEWTAEAEALFEEFAAQATAREETIVQRKAAEIPENPDVIDYKFGGPEPFMHQKRAFLISRDLPAFALLMEQRTGKSKVIVDTASWLYKNEKIDAVVVVAPNGVKTNWVTDEVPTHMPDYIPWGAAYLSLSGRKEVRAKWKALLEEPVGHRLKWMVINIEALSTYQNKAVPGRVQPMLVEFMKEHRCMLVIDESTRIKKWSTHRTKACMALGKLAPYRRILSGMPVTQSPMDVYAPFYFLDPNILGFTSQYAFRNHFAIMGGWNGKEIIGFQRLDELQQLVKSHSFRVLRSECRDMPPQMYQKLTVELSEKQRSIYNQMRDHMLAEYEGVKVTASIVLTQMMRLQQIVGGFMAPDGEQGESKANIAIPGENPKLEALLDMLEEESRKVIVWARFRPEIKLVAEALRARYGDVTVVEFHGGVDDEDRITARQSFQDLNSPVRFFVGQQGTGGIGIPLHAADVVVYFSNSFSLEDRKQSEDRAEGLQRTTSVTYVDLVANNTVDDKKVIPSLRAKQSFANQVTGDNWKEWI